MRASLALVLYIMPIVITPRFSVNTVGGVSPSREYTFGLTGSDDEQAASTAFVLYLPTTIDFYGDGSLILPRQEWRLEHRSLNMWDAKATYASRQRQAQTGDNLLSFDTTGGTQHITQSRATRAAYFAAGATSAPDFKGGINASAESVEGIDITTPSFNFARTVYKPSVLITNAYVQVLKDMTSAVNQAPFYGFDAGEVLFMGARGQQRPQLDWEVAFQFSAQNNDSNINVPGIAGQISKFGWEYLWVLREPKVDSVNKTMVQVPKAAYVEQLYLYGDFDLLGIGS